MLAALDEVLDRQKASAEAARTQPVTRQDPASAPRRALPIIGAVLGVLLLGILAIIYRVVTVPVAAPGGSAVALPPANATSGGTSPSTADPSASSSSRRRP
jgi:hypothetical protein